MRSTAVPLSALLCCIALLPGVARAQAPATPFPACTSQGVSRVAITVPPDRTEDQVRATLVEANAFPAGTEMHFLTYGQVPAIRNHDHVRKRFEGTVRRLLNDGFKIDGTVSVLLQVDEDGTVRQATPNSGNRAVDHQLRRLWSEARFEPLVISGCRVRAWLQVPVAFASDYSLDMRRLEARTGPPPR